MSARDQFQRTECGCEQCRVGCRTMPGALGVGDVERISLHLRGRPVDDAFVEGFFCASEGAKVGRFTATGVESFRIPTITPRQRDDCQCVFLQQDGKCGVHPVAPFGCACCDSHMTREDGDRRSSAMLRDILEDARAGGSYDRQWRMLAGAGITARPLAERRAAFELEYARHEQRGTT